MVASLKPPPANRPPHIETGAKPARRREFRNINALRDLPTYRLPAAGLVSILHRLSGVAMFLLMPLIIWMFDASVSSERSFYQLAALFNGDVRFIPGWVAKFLALGLIWAFLHHFIAGLRHLWMDLSHTAVGKEIGARSAWVTLWVALLLTSVAAIRLFGIY